MNYPTGQSSPFFNHNPSFQQYGTQSQYESHQQYGTQTQTPTSIPQTQTQTQTQTQPQPQLQHQTLQNPHGIQSQYQPYQQVWNQSPWGVQQVPQSQNQPQSIFQTQSYSDIHGPSQHQQSQSQQNLFNPSQQFWNQSPWGLQQIPQSQHQSQPQPQPQPQSQSQPEQQPGQQPAQQSFEYTSTQHYAPYFQPPYNPNLYSQPQYQCFTPNYSMGTSSQGDYLLNIVHPPHVNEIENDFLWEQWLIRLQQVSPYVRRTSIKMLEYINLSILHYLTMDDLKNMNEELFLNAAQTYLKNKKKVTIQTRPGCLSAMRNCLRSFAENFQ